VIDYKGPMLISSHDHQFMQTTATRVIELSPKGIIDKQLTYDEYLENDDVTAKKEALQIK
jgi:ATPase subunit of ABC transporter with duplicated ATPase domains